MDEKKEYVFESERLGFRRWKKSDYEPFAQMNSNREVMRYFPKQLTKEESNAFIQRIESHFEEHGYGLWAVELKESHVFIGFIGFFNTTFEAEFTPCIEIGWRLSNNFWNQGYASEGAVACLDFGFASLGFMQVHSFTSEINHPSIGVMKKIGMNCLGEFEHPRIEEGNPLKKHVLYNIVRNKNIYFHEVIGEEKDENRTLEGRISVRGVVVRDKKMLLIATKRGDYIIPGGGIEEGETAEHALAREIEEETGYKTVAVNDYLGQVLFRKTDKFNSKKQYEILSRFYLCEVDPVQGKQQLSASEIKLQFKPKWVDFSEAIKANNEFAKALDINDHWSDCANFVIEQSKKLID